MRRNALLFVLISLLSGLGSTAMSLAAGIWVLDLTGSVGLAALTGLCVYAPTLAAPWLGALVDRLPRRPLLIAVDAVLGLSILALLLVSSRGSAWLIYAVLLARGLGYVLGDAGESAILPSALPAKLLGDVNGWRSSAQEGMKIVAPLLGAGLYAWRGPIPVVLICTALPLCTAACYALIRLPHDCDPPMADARRQADRSSRRGEVRAGRQADRSSYDEARAERRADWSSRDEAQAGRQADRSSRDEARAGRQADRSSYDEARTERRADWSSRGEVRAGLRALFGDPGMRGPVLVAAVAIGLSGLVNAATIGQVVHGLHLPATRLGLLSTAQGSGSIVGGLLVGRLLARRSPLAVAALGTILFAAACACSAIPWWPAMIGGRALSGFGLVLALIAGVTAVQTRTSDHLLGRVSATSNTVMFGPVALTIPLGSALVRWGPTPLFLTAAALATAAARYRPRSAVTEPSPAAS